MVAQEIWEKGDKICNAHCNSVHIASDHSNFNTSGGYFYGKSNIRFLILVSNAPSHVDVLLGVLHVAF